MGRRSKNKHGRRESNSGTVSNTDTSSRQEIPQGLVAATKGPEESNISHYMSVVSPDIASDEETGDVTLSSCNDTITVENRSLVPSATVKNTRIEANITTKPKLDKTKKKGISASTVPGGKKTVVDGKLNINREKTMVFFDLIEKVAERLKSGDEGQPLTLIQKLMSVMEDTDEKKVKATYRMLDGFLSTIKNCNRDYVTYMEEHIKSIIIPEELCMLFVHKDMIKEGYNLLGKGPFGKVSKGKLIRPGQSAVAVAIKEGNETRFNSMLIEEAMIMSQLDHDVILKVLAFTNVGGSIKLALELMEFGDIFDAITEDHVFLTHADLLRIILDVSSGMEYLTDKEYIHRDLKCQNVFLNRKKECKIGDFGICKYVGDSGGTYKENDMRVNGIHVAPESNETNKFTRKSDIWAMGILIWDLYSINSIWRNTQDPMKLSLMMSEMRAIFMITGHLPQPRNCPVELHQYVVEDILNVNPSRRPEFGNIKKKVLHIMGK